MRKKILAVASAGGHWVQLLRISPAFEGQDVLWVSTLQGLSSKIPFGRFRSVRDASMWSKMSLAVMALQILFLIVRYRPDVVISTGAAPGYFAIVFGRFFGANTIWIDSIANSEELSLAGKKVRVWARHWLTQWPELAKDEGPKYFGAVL